jgi:ketosteroid isomerase-like protein
MRPHPKEYAMNNNRYHLLLVSLLAVWAGLAVSSCSKTSAQPERRQRNSIARLLDAYTDGYKTGDFGRVRFAADVTFEGPLKGPIRGESAVRTFLSTVRAKDVRVKRQIIDGQFACVLPDFETMEGIAVPFCEFFRIRDGEIAEIRPYFDPRPFIR